VPVRKAKTALEPHNGSMVKRPKKLKRPPSGYAQRDLNDPEQLAIAILTAKKKFNIHLKFNRQ
jgi:hypothetical protein